MFDFQVSISKNINDDKRNKDGGCGSFFGSGSLEQDGPLSVVAMKKEEQTGLMHDHRLGKGQRHAHKTSQTLAQGVVPSLHVGSFSRLFSHRSVLLLWDHRRVSRPEIREAVPL